MDETIFTIYQVLSFDPIFTYVHPIYNFKAIHEVHSCCKRIMGGLVCDSTRRVCLYVHAAVLHMAYKKWTGWEVFQRVGK